MKFKTYLAELRAPFFTGSIIPVILGTALAWQTTGHFSLVYFLAALVGGMSLHAGANVANDYFDWKNGTDNINKEFVRPFNGGSRMIQNGIMTPKEVLVESAVCYLIAFAIGIWLISQLGVTILWLGIIGAVCGFFYSAPPLKFVARRGLGEFIIALNFGVLMTLGAYFVQTGTLAWRPIIVSLPIAILIAAILYINEFQDYTADKEAGKNHLVATLGKRRAATGYLVLLAAAYLSIVAGIATGALSPWGLFALATLPLAVRAARVARRHYDDSRALVPANAGTIQIHLLVGLILSAACIVDV